MLGRKGIFVLTLMETQYKYRQLAFIHIIGQEQTFQSYIIANIQFLKKVFFLFLTSSKYFIDTNEKLCKLLIVPI